jgi:acyl-CoA synthetase (AMP-forming)/AMP-acid ligase II
MTIPAMLADNLRRYAPRTALVDGDTRLSYAQLEQRMQQVAAWLRAAQLGPGDVVALWAPNSWQWVVSALAGWWTGCTLVPIPGRGRILDALPILRATRARVLFTCSAQASGNLPSLIANHLNENRATLQHVCPDLQRIVDFSQESAQPGPGQFETVPFAGIGPVAVPLPAAAVAGDDTAVVLFTSGSTGRPKGVPRRHEQSLRNRWVISRQRGYCPADRLLVVSEFSHSMGLGSNLLCSLMMGSTLVVANTRNPGEIARLIGAEGITSIAAPPSLFAGLLRERIGERPACASLRLALTAATNVPPALVRALIATGVDAVVSAYGMTECEVVTSTAIGDRADVIATTVGTLIAGLELRVADENGAALPAELAGEIWLRGSAVSPCYLGAGGELESAVDAQGWLHTGDVGCYAADGRLRILGRRKEAMTIHGYTVYPAEIEALLIQSGMLKEIAVIGAPHEVAGQISVAYIVPVDPSAFDLKRLRLWARGNVADYKIPGRFVLLDKLPLNETGKVDRIALQCSLGAGQDA